MDPNDTNSYYANPAPFRVGDDDNDLEGQPFGPQHTAGSHDTWYYPQLLPPTSGAGYGMNANLTTEFTDYNQPYGDTSYPAVTGAGDHTHDPAFHHSFNQFPYQPQFADQSNTGLPSAAADPSLGGFGLDSLYISNPPLAPHPPPQQAGHPGEGQHRSPPRPGQDLWTKEQDDLVLRMKFEGQKIQAICNELLRVYKVTKNPNMVSKRLKKLHNDSVDSEAVGLPVVLLIDLSPLLTFVIT